MSADPVTRPRELRADCANCFGLCCVVPAFTKSSDFAIDKPAGHACPNLRADFGCGIHNRLRPSGFAGCTVYDCFGAGQKIAQLTFDGRDWRREPELAPRMFAAFEVMRDLHELLWYVTEALAMPQARSVHPALAEALRDTRALTGSPPDDLVKLDIDAVRRKINPLLLEASEIVRRAAASGASKRKTADHRGADLIGAKFGGADLRNASLRGAFLIGADLRRADLRGADVIGADFRGADLRGADLRSAIFLIQAQVDAARGDATTRLPGHVRHPAHWPG